MFEKNHFKKKKAMDSTNGVVSDLCGSIRGKVENLFLGKDTPEKEIDEWSEMQWSRLDGGFMYY